MAVLLNIPSPCACCGASGPNVEAICLEGTYLFPPVLTLTNTFNGNHPCREEFYPSPHVETFQLFAEPAGFFGNAWKSAVITFPSPNDDWQIQIVFACFPNPCLGQQYPGQPPYTTQLQVTFFIVARGSSTIPPNPFLPHPGWKCSYGYTGFGFCGYLDSVSPLVWRGFLASLATPGDSMFVTE